MITTVTVLILAVVALVSGVNVYLLGRRVGKLERHLEE